MRKLLAILATLAILALPASAPVLATGGSCGAVGSNGAGVVDITGTTDSDGRCTVAVGQGQPAWRWLDAEVTITCEPATGSGTTRQVDGFYLWGITRDSDGNVTSQGYVGTTWTGCGLGDTATRTYHLQLVMQGTDRTVQLVTQRRTWPYAAASAVAVSRDYTGTVHVH